MPPNVTFAPGSTAIERVGTVLARATVAAKPPVDPDQDGAEVIAGLDELGAVHLDGAPGRLAQLAVVVTGARERASAEPAVLGLVHALDAGGGGAVLVGPGPTPVAVGWARAGGPGGASSVDSADSAAGQVALVLALAEQVAGAQGAYGAGAGATTVLSRVGALGARGRLIASKPVDGWSLLRARSQLATRAHGSPRWPRRRRPSTSSSPEASPPRSARA